MKRDPYKFLAEEFDQQWGGFGYSIANPNVPKFPTPGNLEFLLYRVLQLRASDKSGEKELEMLTNQLDHMSLGGIRDHLGGGFHRYSVDRFWHIPHFEKMLYDNAQLASIYAATYKLTGDVEYKQVTDELLQFVLREMTDESGGFYSALDADSEGEEGKFYVWSESEIRHLLGNDANTFIAAYDIRTEGNWEGKNILNRSSDPILKTIDIENQLLQNRKTLFNYRKKRIAPALDDKILADWNGLMISALVRASQVFEKPNWLRKAEKAFNFVVTNMCHSGDEKLRLLHSYRLDIAKHLATLDDYANMSRAGLLLFESTNNYEYLDNVKCWIKVLDKFYWDEDLGGYYFTSQDAEDVIVRTKTCIDNATPSGNGIIAEVLARLYYLTGHDYYRKRCESVITAFSAEAEKNPYGHVTLINAAQFLIEAVQIIIIGDMDDEDTKELLAAQNLFNIPTRVLSIIPDGQNLLFRPKIDQLVFDIDILAVKRQGGIYLSFLDMISVLDFAIDYDDENYTAQGWFLREDWSFGLDYEERKIISRGEAYDLNEENTFIENGELYFREGFLESIFALDLDFDIGQQYVLIDSEYPLPRIAAENRKNRRQVFFVGSFLDWNIFCIFNIPINC